MSGRPQPGCVSSTGPSHLNRDLTPFVFVGPRRDRGVLSPLDVGCSGPDRPEAGTGTGTLVSGGTGENKIVRPLKA